MTVRNGNNGVMVERRAVEAPKNLMEIITILAEAIKSLCHTDIPNLHRAIVHAVLDKGKKRIGSECRERSDCVEVKDTQMLKELYELKRLLRRTMLFSSPKRYLTFLFAAGFEHEDVLQRERTSGILKPAFTVIRDQESKCLLVFIRGTRSIKDIVTDALCAPVPFNHSMVSGHAHSGMAASADWIRERCVPLLLEALRQYPHYKIKIVGHSLGGGTAALLTYKLREIQQLSSTTCVTFGPAACMTLGLAEFGKPFITSVINGCDIVPTLSVSSFYDFIDEGRTKDKNIGISFAKAIAKHAVHSCTEVVKKHKHSLFHRENIRALSENLVEASGLSGTSFEPLLSEEHLLIESIDDNDEYNSSSEGSDNDDSDDDNENEDQLLNEMGNLELRKHVYIPDIHAKEKDISDETSARRRLYPPGKIMHMITSHMSENSNSNQSDADEKHVCLYRTPTQLYGKLRFSRGIILDHCTKRYLKKLQQLINTLEKE
ncbi:uncharacterized protein LOC114174688 [Vigna unguiculata]|uniref:Sn1-specific diacylglycerol lipase alpha n=1 Tax=Vigna unguiculata TaxID=3917 RepID=A0A4D6LQP1_VIGUN|nr:uncharacterized protein LOC114174688 [Vigna unguiculata]QCD90841.1 sn1-specific diacylglycerol lipase alpha [Vigna unguiculata]